MNNGKSFNGDENGDEKLVLKMLMEQPNITAKELSILSSFSMRKISRIVKRLRESGKIIRIGSCGVYTPDIDLLDTILVDKTYTEGNFAYEWNSNDCHLMQADETLNSKIEEAATKLNIHYTKGNTLCSDCFDGYLDNLEMLLNRLPKDLNLIGAEMEAFALFYIAKYLNKKAACLLTVVDSLAKKQSSTAEEREKSLNNMIKIALESI